MAYLRQKRNRILISGILLLLAAGLLTISPVTAKCSLIFYDPDFDISMGSISYFAGSGENNPVISPGIYFGGYLGMKSPLFANYFKTQRIYNIFEVGLALNEITMDPDSGDRELLITVPLLIDFAYRLNITKKFLFLPFAGMGFSFTHIPHISENSTNISPLITVGAQLKYLITDTTSLKLQFDYGIALDNRTDSGIIQFIKVRFPVPFIP